MPRDTQRVRELGLVSPRPLHSLFNAFSLWQLEGVSEHLSQVWLLPCPQPSRVPTSLGIKAHIFPLPSPPHSLPLDHSASDTRASSLFLQHARHSPVPQGLCTGLSLCLGCCFLNIFIGLFLNSCGQGGLGRLLLTNG